MELYSGHGFFHCHQYWVAGHLWRGFSCPTSETVEDFISTLSNYSRLGLSFSPPPATSSSPLSPSLAPLSSWCLCPRPGARPGRRWRSCSRERLLGRRKGGGSTKGQTRAFSQLYVQNNDSSHLCGNEICSFCRISFEHTFSCNPRRADFKAVWFQKDEVSIRSNLECGLGEPSN